MYENDKGFLEPRIDMAKCMHCGKCEAVCPLNLSPDLKCGRTFIAAKHKNIRKRLKSQSGAAFAGMAEFVLAQQGVIYGVAQDDSFEAVYKRIDKLQELKKLFGSKYIQARVENIFQCVLEDLVKGSIVLFSGTPCHADGLRRFLLQKRINIDKLIIVDIICHGVPSPRLYREYLQLFERVRNLKVTGFDFRNKKCGWHGHMALIRTGRKQFCCDDFVRFFYSHYALRDSCYCCHYANLCRVGDVTVGDCWGIEKTDPIFDDNKGVSLVILNTEKGKKIWDNISVNYDFVEKQSSEIMQHNLREPTEAPELLGQFWMDYAKYGSEYVLRHYCGCNPDGEEEYINKSNYLRRLVRKISKIIKKTFYL